MQILANGIVIEYEEYGKKTDPVLILIRGLGSQLIHWPQNLISGFTEVGYRVIIFDNRDIGLSARCPKDGFSYDKENIVKTIDAGKNVVPAYSLDDMALDVIGLMDAIGIDKAHIFGMSLGGAITQVLLINHQARILSAVIVMSSSKLSDQSRIKKIALQHTSKYEYIENAVSENKLWGNSSFPVSENYVRDVSGRAFDRGAESEAVNRQASAVYSFGDRREALKATNLPCLVIHGEDDVLVLPEEGKEISSLIKDSEIKIIGGMGHEITPLLSSTIINLVHDFLSRRCNIK
jgi:pimeloyl-ACP methyl ester carboxylesterase